MIYEHYKNRDTDGSVLDISDLLKIELRGDNAQTFNTRWDESMITMKKQSGEEQLENLHPGQTEKSDKFKQIETFALHVIHLVTNLSLLLLQSQEKERGRPPRLQPMGLQKVNVPEDKIVVSSMIRPRKDRGA